MAALEENPGLIRRDSILGAVVEVVAERGVANSSVELVCARARVSRRTFHGCFAGGLDECLVAVMDGALAQVGALAVRSFEQEDYWLDGMRLALVELLAFFDREPALARVCLVETLGGGPMVREQRERVVASFRGLVVERIEGEVSHASPLAAEGVVASVMGVMRARLIAGESRPLVGLLGPLMGIIVGQFAFMDEVGVAREIEKGDELARELLAEHDPAQDTSCAPAAVAVRAEVLEALGRPGAFRVRQCLLYVGSHGGEPGPSNRDVKAGIGVSHRGQVSTLLARLAGMGLLVKRSGAPGRPNAWRLTAEGEAVVSELQRERYTR